MFTKFDTRKDIFLDFLSPFIAITPFLEEPEQCSQP